MPDSIAFFKKRNFDFNLPLKVTFEGEPAIDGGGPKREFLTLLLRELLSQSSNIHLFEGNDGINGGPGFPFFSKAVYKYIQCTDTYEVTEHLTKDDVVDIEVIEAINKM